MIHESCPEPPSFSTFPLSSLTSGATPRYFPSLAAPLPVMIDATCVPCPTRSSSVSLRVKFFAPTTASDRSGCVASIPVSSTATVAPAPVCPAAQASGAPICATLRSRVARTGPSSQTCSAALAVGQNVPDRSTETAAALRAGSSWLTCTPAVRGVRPA